MRIILGVLGLVVLVQVVQAQSGDKLDAFDYRGKYQAVGQSAGCVSAHPLASRVGIDILRAGGNAFDAAIAMQFALAVVFPRAGNIGGGGFALARTKEGRFFTWDFREVAGEHASANMFVEARKHMRKRRRKYRVNPSQKGGLAVGVPGSVAGIFALLPYAYLPINVLIAPAIELARFGFALTQKQAIALNKHKVFFNKLNSYRVPFVKARGKWKAGDTLVQEALATTLAKIRDSGADGFYSGSVARKILSSLRAQGGILTRNDFLNYRVKMRSPLRFTYRHKYEIITMPLPSSGGIVLAQCLQMIANKRGDIREYAYMSPFTAQLFIEAERRAYADRAACMADPDFVNVPVDTLVSTAYLQRKIADFSPGHPSANRRIVRPPCASVSEETTHVNVVDSYGNMLSVTTTLNGNFGSFVVPEGTGVILNNQMDDFTTQPDHPNLYGAVDGRQNLPAPGKKMLSSMTPTIVLENGRPFLLAGSPGGTTIPTTILQVLLNRIDFQKTGQQNLATPRFHFQHTPDVVFVEKKMPSSWRKILSRMGYRVKERSSIGRAKLIEISDGVLQVSGDERSDDAAEAY